MKKQSVYVSIEKGDANGGLLLYPECVDECFDENDEKSARYLIWYKKNCCYFIGYL